MNIRCMGIAGSVLAASLWAMAGPASAAPLTAVQCGDTIDRSIRVANSIFGCDLNGLVVDRDGITINLGGNFIAGNGADADDEVGMLESGIRCVADCTGVSVRNGSLRDFEAGVFIGGSGQDVTLRDLHVSENEHGFHLNGSKISVRATTSRENGNGLSVFGSRTTIADVRTEANDVAGYLIQSDRNTLRNNESLADGVDGFAVNGDRNELVANLAEASSSDGFSVAGDENALRRNVARSNSSGFRIEGVTAVLEDNLATDSGFDGFVVSGAEHSLTGDVAAGNGRLGFALGGAGSSLVSGLATGNISDGILVFGSGSIVRQSKATGNGDDGIDVSAGADQALVRNVANRNGFLNGVADGSGLGIRIAPAVTNLTARSNSARANDDPNACTPGANCE